MCEQPWILDRFDDCQILRYEVPGFEELPLDEKIYIYYLARAAREGRDILLDQNFKYNIYIRNLFRAILTHYQGDQNCEEWCGMVKYAKHIWFANGIHHHYSGEKFTPEFSESYFRRVVDSIPVEQLPLPGGVPLTLVAQILFDPELFRWRITRSVDVDVVETSACNYYDGVTTQQAQEFYSGVVDGEPTALHPLNSRLVATADGGVEEQVYSLAGRYAAYIERIVYWLNQASTVANDRQREIIELLVEFYTTGDAAKFDEYSIAWLRDSGSRVDFINGFIEVYGDPIGLKGAWESLVNFRNEEASRRTSIIAANAQWFEDHSPINPLYRKPEVTGVSAKVVTVAMLGGDCYPATPIGINLPNAEWIRRDYGSKSVTIDNVTHAYDKVSQASGFVEAFYYGESLRADIGEWGKMTDDLHTDLHECVGHGSGRLADGVSQDALGSYSSVVEECRADLYGLYYMGDDRLIDLGLVPCKAAVAAYYTKYITNGALTQLARIKLGDNVEQTHMRNRKIISEWLLERTADSGAVCMSQIDGCTYIVLRDADEVRMMIGELLCEIQRIKSEGDLVAARDLVERLGVHIDGSLHAEILERYARLNISPYNGFVNPRYELVMDGDRIVDVLCEQPQSLDLLAEFA
ncbi:MAG: dihydrofolate reductase [Rikenellaceae bacterium]